MFIGRRLYGRDFAHQSGIENVVASSGTALTTEQIKTHQTSHRKRNHSF